MKRDSVLLIAQIILIILGVVMVLIGGVLGKKFMLPPILTGLGFFVIAWAFSAFKKNSDRL